MEDAKNSKTKSQVKIDGMLEAPRPQEFRREALLHAVAQFIACDDQSLAVANKPSFRNCLLAMRPKTIRPDLPSTHEVTKYLHNEFVAWLKTLKNDIEVSQTRLPNTRLTKHYAQCAPGKVSATADGWTADHTKASFLGMTAHWIEVTDGKWKLRSEVVGFQGISGDHSGWNLGHYFVGLCDCVGICGKDGSKVCNLILDWSSITDEDLL